MPDYCSLEEAFNTHTPSSKKREGFRSLKQSNNEHFENASSRKSYGAQSSDYKYMCDTAGICIGEKFKNQSPAPAPAPSQFPSQSSTAAQKCAPLSAPKYDYPLSDEDKQRFKEVIKIALEEMESSKSPAPPAQAQSPAPSPDSMSDIDGYIDSELESYMMVNDMKSEVPSHKQAQQQPIATPEVPKDMPAYQKEITRGYPFDFMKETDLGMPTKKSEQPQNVPENFTKKYKLLFDLLLFSITGILIIMILEQLFKIALLQGMNKTIISLEKILEGKTIYRSDTPM